MIFMGAEAIKKSLEGSGLRCTPQRFAVMAFLTKHTGHPTAAEIFAAVNRADPRSSRAAARDSRRKACRITTSYATAAAMLKTWSGTTCPSPPRAPWASGWFANANSFSGGSARSALRRCSGGLRPPPSIGDRRYNPGGQRAPLRGIAQGLMSFCIILF